MATGFKQKLSIKKVSTFASHTNPSTERSFQKSFQLSSPEKIELKKSPPLKIKNTQRHNLVTDKY